MISTDLPPHDEMMVAFMSRDTTYDGVFVTGVDTTGIFCRPSCPARKPRPENVTFFPAPRDAVLAGYRPCRRCRPLEAAGTPPPWLADLLADVENEPLRRWTDADLRSRGLSPERVRRWFQKEHGLTFHGYQRARRLGVALGQIRHGADVTSTAFDHGYDSQSGFNAAFRQLFGDPPSEARQNGPVVTVNRVLTPLGPMLVGTVEEGLCIAEFVDRRMLETQLERLRRHLGHPVIPGAHPLIDRASVELGEYFEGRRTEFSVPLVDPGSELQRAVWDALRAIPYGATLTYGEIAQRVGRPGAARAIGRAVGDNRLAILLPCHRVVGADGRLTGYGGGMWRKQRLLDLEARVLAGQEAQRVG